MFSKEKLLVDQSRHHHTIEYGDEPHKDSKNIHILAEFFSDLKATRIFKAQELFKGHFPSI